VHRRAVEDYLETLARPALLIGNSLGGLVAELVAAERPDLVEALVTVSPATPIPPGRTEIDWEVTRRLILQALPVVGTLYVRSYFSRTTAAQQVADTLGLVTYRRTAVSQEMVLESVRLARFRRAMPWVVPALVGAGRSTGIYLARRKRFAEMISRVKAPTLLIQGVHDRVIAPGSIRWLASLRPDWRLEMMEDTAHCPQLDTPERFVALIDDWLASMSSGPRR
jgi:pimeloyl-ACP methyl ester carboxylesterase